MGIYINKGNGLFRQSRNSEYIDKSGLIAVVNSTLFTRQRYTCVTRSRRFGKSMAAEMLAIAYYYAHGDYIFHREYQTGRGFADLVMIPRKNVTTPAIIVELKYNDTTGTALDQIHDRHYPDKVAEYSGDMLLVAVTYDRKTKEHRCEIEAMKK
jgi:hypothetical protein